MKYTEISASLQAGEHKLAIIVSRFNSIIGEQLLNGCIEGLERHGALKESITVIRVPGAFEIPMIAKKLAISGKYAALICLGAVIRGDTPHFDYVAAESPKGISKVSLESGIPVINGILTTDTVEQALERAGLKAGNKGFDAAMTAIEMVNLLQLI